jgi:hypothetical protein
VAKAIFAILSGLDIGPVRLPLTNLSPEQISDMKKDLVLSGLADIMK